MLSGARSEIVAWRGTARTAMGCGAVGVRALRAWGTGARWGKVVVQQRMHGDAPTARCECDGEEHASWTNCCASP